MYSGKFGCIRAKVLVLGQKFLYLGKIGYIQVKLIVLRQGGWDLGKRGYNLAKWLYSGKVVVFGQ